MGLLSLPGIARVDVWLLLILALATSSGEVGDVIFDRFSSSAAVT